MVVLDVGTEAVKVISGEKRLLQYLDDYDAPENYSRAVDWAFRGFANKPEKIILGLPANALRARIVFQKFERKNPKRVIDEKEERAIHQAVSKKAEEEVSRIFSSILGILPKDIRIVNIKIIESIIDGYEVPGLRSYGGKNLEFRILASFSSGLGEVERVVQKKAANIKLVHGAEGLILALGDYPEGIFLDVGGEATQIFLASGGKLIGLNEFDIGGKFFSEAISEKLGLREKDARIFKEKYGKKELTLESSLRVKELFYFPQRAWFESLKARLKETKESCLFSSNIILFGGGSQLPEIREILQEGDWGNISFADRKPKVEILKDPQFVPASLIASYYAKKNY